MSGGNVDHSIPKEFRTVSSPPVIVLYLSIKVRSKPWLFVMRAVHPVSIIYFVERRVEGASRG